MDIAKSNKQLWKKISARLERLRKDVVEKPEAKPPEKHYNNNPNNKFDKSFKFFNINVNNLGKNNE